MTRERQEASRRPLPPTPAAAGRRSEAGIALLLVLMLMTLLTVAVMESLRSVEMDFFNAAYIKNSTQAETIANSGVQVALTFLCRNRIVSPDVVHPQQLWAWRFNEAAMPWLKFSTGRLDGYVEDESGKLPINILANKDGGYNEPIRGILKRLLMRPPFELPEDKADALVASLKDWVYSGSPSNSGSLDESKDEYYTGLSTPYYSKRGPMSSLSELLLVRGMTRELYEGKAGLPGLKDLLTLTSDGLININTAPPLILQALPSGSTSKDTAAEFAKSVAQFRKDPKNMPYLGEQEWYRTRLFGFKSLTLPTEILTRGSNYFSLHMTGIVGTVRKHVVTYVQLQQLPKLPLERLPVAILARQVY